MIKSQSAIEFIVLASFMLLIIVGFFAITSSKILEAREEGNKKIAQDIAEFAYREIAIAKTVSDGYTRIFAMPQTVNGIDYSINITDNRELIVNYLDYEYVKFIPANVTGNITKGLNIITKMEGIVYVNGTTVVESSPFLVILLMKNSGNNVIRFDNSGNVVLKGNLQQNEANPPVTGNDEFIFKDSNGNVVAVINLNSGNMFIKGSLSENQPTLTPSPISNDFIVKDTTGNVVSYIDESGNFYLKGTLIENGNP